MQNSWWPFLFLHNCILTLFLCAHAFISLAIMRKTSGVLFGKILCVCVLFIFAKSMYDDPSKLWNDVWRPRCQHTCRRIGSRLYPWLSLSIFVPIFSSVHSELHMYIVVCICTPSSNISSNILRIYNNIVYGRYVGWEQQQQQHRPFFYYTTIYSLLLYLPVSSTTTSSLSHPVQYSPRIISTHTNTNQLCAWLRVAIRHFVLDKIIPIVYTQKLRGQKL